MCPDKELPSCFLSLGDNIGGKKGSFKFFWGDMNTHYFLLSQYLYSRMIYVTKLI